MSAKVEWEKVHQPYELNFHLEDGANFRRDEQSWLRYWEEAFEGLDFTGKCVLDIGAGSRPPLISHPKFKAKSLVCIEPLHGNFVGHVPEAWLKGDFHVCPAEERIAELKGKFDFILCWNVLDHCYDWKQVLLNAKEYLKPNGEIYLATDDKEPHDGHPGLGYGFPDFIKEHFMVKEERRNMFNRDYIFRLCLKS